MAPAAGEAAAFAQVGARGARPMRLNHGPDPAKMLSRAVGVERSVRRTLNRRAVIALTPVLVLLAAAAIVTRLAVDWQAASARGVFAHGRQVVLVHQVTMAISEMARLPAAGDRLARDPGLRRTLARLEAGHARLRSEIAAPDGAAGPVLRRLFLDGPSSADALMREFIRAARGATSRLDRYIEPGAATAILALAHERLVPRLELVSARAAADTDVSLKALMQLELALFIALIGLVAAEWWFLFRPEAARTARKSAELDRLVALHEHRARHDPLTGLANRRFLGERMEAVWSDAAAQAAPVAACHIDLDRFKAVNDLEGHGAGDLVLQEVARILTEIAGDRAFVARVGGDEFVVLLAPPPSEAALAAMAERIIAALSVPLPAGTTSVQIGGSVGIAVATPAERSPERLLMDADVALNAAKRGGKGRHVFYSADMRAAEVEAAILRDELAQAIDRNEIVAVFQPQVRLSTGEVAGFEALMRWNHPRRGLLSPAAFLETAEDAGLIDRMGHAVIRQALAALAGWRREGFDVPQVGINLSSREIRDPRFIEWIRWELDTHDLPPGCLAVELLETVFVERDEDSVVANIRALSELGLRIELDDFGTGHASIANLIRLDVDRVKIDRSFVAGIDRDATRQRLTGAMVSMAQTLGIEVLAEGTETEAEKAALAGLGCDLVQGYGIARPMDRPAATRWLAGRVTDWRADRGRYVAAGI